MKLEDARIKMEVKSSGNEVCTYLIESLDSSGKVGVSLFTRNGKRTAKATEFSGCYLRGFSPVGMKRIKIAKKVTPPTLSVQDGILLDIERILSKGTRIKTFVYDGVTRNVLIGSNDADGYCPWGTRVNRAVVRHAGKNKSYLVAVDNNDNRTIKNFDISKIKGWVW